MENSFFEYRDKSVVDGGTDEEFIDNSFVNDSFDLKKKYDRTVFVAESEDSTTDESEEESNGKHNLSKSVVRRSSLADSHVISSSDDDGSKKGGIRRPTGNSSKKLILTSSDDSADDDQGSPEMIPRRRQPAPKKSVDSNDSIIVRKNRKRVMLLDSDTENSIIIEHDKQNKLACTMETPYKVVNKLTYNNNEKSANDTSMTIPDDANDNTDYDGVNDSKDIDSAVNNCGDINDNDDDDGPNEDLMVMSRATRMSIMGVAPKDHNDDTDDSDFIVSDESNRKSYSNAGSTNSLTDLPDISVAINKTPLKAQATDDDSDYDARKDKSNKLSGKAKPIDNKHNDEKKHCDDKKEHKDDEKHSDDDGPDEDMMVMSKATRLSIMGIMPKDIESDESDFILSDDGKSLSRHSSAHSLNELPDVSVAIQGTPPVAAEEADSSRLTCSPFSSPLHDISNKLDMSRRKTKDADVTEIIDLSEMPTNLLKNKVQNKLASGNVMTYYDDEVTIIDTKPEIIALSSDDDDDVKIEATSPKIKKSPRSKLDVPRRDASIKQYLVPASYPNQVVYVKKHVRENELNKLRSLQEDLNNVKTLLDEMDMATLPDGGARLIERLSALEAEGRRQGDKVANMIVEPDQPSAADVARDGLGQGLSWDELQKASHAVQPRMFGKQAMATHMAERNLILERLRELHASLASRPGEAQRARPPRALAATMMPHQLHALAWLQWRETQRPRAGILADDMGLGKTITMIALIASDQERLDTDDNEDDDDDDGSSKLVRGGSLVVCPASLIQQWGAEVAKHCAPHSLAVCLHHGAARATQPHRLAAPHLVVTTYNILQRDHEKNGVLMRIRWRRVVLDEAHIVRNHKAATSVAVSALRAARRWCLTGTPVQNKDLDLFALLKFLRCTPFDDLTMWKKWIDNKSAGGQDRLSSIMQCLLLRRTKVQLQQAGQLACLPAKTCTVRPITLSKQEMNVYQKVLVLSKSLFGQFLQQRAEKHGYAAGPARDSEYAKMHKRMIALQGVKPVKSHEILVLLLRLRQVCCHCGLIAAMLDEGDPQAAPDPAGADLLDELNKLSLEDSRRKSGGHADPDAEEEEEAGAAGATAAEAIRAVLAPNNPVFELATPSSKIKDVMKCLQENVLCNKGDKAVVVSQWTSVLRLVEAQLNERRVRSVTLSGAVPVPARPALIKAVNDPNSDVRVMLLSLCAGGVGINLCGANHLLLLDPHWNPQLEEQAQDRIYRVGQAKDVNIYRFMCVDTVEQSIRKLQEAKLALAENVLTGARNNASTKLSIEDLKVLFNM